MRHGGITGIGGGVRYAYGAIGAALLVLVLNIAWDNESRAATATQGAEFDHLSTAFPLTGAHRLVRCESCHVDAVFRNTPRQCNACHTRDTRINATPAPADQIHARTRANCDSCHRTSSWANARFDHSGVTDDCAGCHSPRGGARRAPSDPVHARAGSTDCSACHRSTRSFATGTMDHSGITGGCAAAGCHAGDRSRAANHATLLTCESCHRYPNWGNVRMDHGAIGTASCRGCHTRGGYGTASPNDSIHAGIGSQDCKACHTTSGWGGARVDHSLITGGCAAAGCHAGDRTRAINHTALVTCESCHRYPSWTSANMDHGAIGSATCRGCHTQGGLGTAAPNDTRHATLGTQDCRACHSTTSWAGAQVDHSRITSGCAASGCHANDRNRALNHTALITCESCHRYPSWTSVTMNHSAIGSATCKGCHTQGGIATAPPNDTTHANLGTQDCRNCHTTTSFSGARVDHSRITSGCAASGCHAADRSRADNHAAIGSCESCHRYPSWTSVNMNHSAIGTARCDGCHKRGGIAQGAPNDSRHSNLGGRDCNACHSTRSFD